MNTAEQSASENTDGSIQCLGSKEHAVRIFIVAVMCLAFGLYCVYDLFFTDSYPYVSLSDDMNKFFSWAFNWVVMVLTIPLGLVFAYFGLDALKRKVIADESRIGYAGKNQIYWPDVTQLDASKLADKQILILIAGGNKIKFDGYKLLEFKKLVDFIETHIPQQAETIT